jgi:hypothetical protein
LPLSLTPHLPTIPLPIDEEIIEPKDQQREAITLQILGILSAEIDRGGDATDDGDLVGIDEGPGGGETGAAPALEEPQPRHHGEVVGPGVAELVPPILADDLGRVDLGAGPEVRVARVVEEDGLEDVLLEGDGARELRLVVGAVEAHFEFGGVGWVLFDVVHGFEVGGGEGVAHGLVDAAQGLDSAGRAVEVFVVPFHVRGVGVGDGDVVGEFGGAEYSAFAEGAGAGEEAFGCVGAGEGG